MPLLERVETRSDSIWLFLEDRYGETVAVRIPVHNSQDRSEILDRLMTAGAKIEHN